MCMLRSALMSMRRPLACWMEGAKMFAKSRNVLMDLIGSKSSTLAKVS
jgi:hypothetical protein